MTSEPQHRTPGLTQDALEDSRWPVSARNLLTVREWSFYDVLCALYPDHKVFVKVALSQLIDEPDDHPERQSIGNRFLRGVADFVLCGSDLGVVAVIDLDDRSLERADRQVEDDLKTKRFAAAGIRRVRIAAGPLPSSQQLRHIMVERDGLDGPAPSVVATAATPGFEPDKGRYENSDVAPNVPMGSPSLGTLGR